ncbi:hypothetical protein [Bacillus atrophaeus]|nr:hypothetical protein [Bacillus atrophaeus]
MASDKEWVKISELSEEEKQSLTAGTAVMLMIIIIMGHQIKLP